MDFLKKINSESLGAFFLSQAQLTFIVVGCFVIGHFFLLLANLLKINGEKNGKNKKAS